MRLKADLQLLLVSVIWGIAFVVMRVAAGYHSIFLLNGVRFLLGGLLLIPLVRFRDAYRRDNLLVVFLGGFSLYAALSLQQAGLTTTTAANAGFITCLYVIIIPLVLWLFWKERPSAVIFAAIPLAIGGGYLLSTGGRLHLKAGDLLIFISSFFWAMHVIVVAKSQGRITPLPFAFGQYLVCSLLCLLTGVWFEHPSQADWIAMLPAILYTGVFSIALGFTLQVYAQKHTPANDTVVILSMQAVFAAVFGWLLIKEPLMPVQIAGSFLILVSVLLVQFKNGKMKSL